VGHQNRLSFLRFYSIKDPQSYPEVQNALPSGLRQPLRHYSQVWICTPQFEVQRDFNPPGSCAATHTLWGDPTPHRLLTSLIRAACRPYSLLWGELHGASQVAMSHQCVACQGLRPRGARSTLPCRLLGCCFLARQNHRPTRFANFGAQSLQRYFRPTTSFAYA
jgi:hypothetical protein